MDKVPVYIKVGLSVTAVLSIVALVVGILIGLKVIPIQTQDTQALTCTTPQATTPQTITPQTTTPPPQASTPVFVDRGFWNDGGYEHASSDNWYQNAFYNRAIPNVISIDAGLRTNDEKLKWAKEQAIAGKYDTFAFQNGNQLFLGNYMDTTTDGTLYKYDKFGPAASNSDFLGGPYINHVFSTVAPNSIQTRESDFVDRGCWLDIPRVVSLSWIDMNQTGLRGTEWYKYAMQKATEGGYDTFAFQAGFALFLGKYSPTYRYDKIGESSACADFGLGAINRVYSTINPLQ